jgi:ribosomal protein L24
LQLTAMRLEIENLKQRSKNQNSSEESESEDEEDEEMMLNFSNLKKIDRKSVSISVDKRKSRVTISGDTAF